MCSRTSTLVLFSPLLLVYPESAEVQRLKRVITLLKSGQAVPDTELADLERSGVGAGDGDDHARTPGGISSSLPDDDHAYDDGPVHRPEPGGSPGTHA